MKRVLFARGSLQFALSLTAIFAGISCSTTRSTEAQAVSFSGEAQAIQLADQMFEAIGGKQAWCELTSLYIKAEHNEPQMTIPYQSEIWRAMDRFELVIEQQNDSFHVKAVIGDAGGTIRYYDKRDTSRVLKAEQLDSWAFDHTHNVYVLLHDLGCHPENYRVEIDAEKRLAFYQDTTFLTSFGLDDQLRPFMFYRPNPDGSVSGSIFTHWGTDAGLVHSAGGHPLDSSFVYQTEIWQADNRSMREAFGEEIFSVE